MSSSEARVEDVQNELATIRRAIAESRRATARWGDAYVMWGLLIGVALAVQWWGWAHGVAAIWIVWVVAAVAGLFISLLLRRRRVRGGEVVSLASRSIRTVWSLCSLAIWTFAFVGIPAGVISQELIMPLIAMEIAIAAITTGATVRSRVFAAAGWLWFAGSVLSLFLPLGIQFPVFLFLIVAGEIVPGLWLWRFTRGMTDAA
ncbi:MAG: hypothetical protein GXP47_08070 [Acidobacteria bacterium]|nr:hypothetical protein [Acidobacteriota bacterium]